MRSPSALARCFFSWFAWMVALLKMTRCPPSPFLPPAAMAEPGSQPAWLRLALILMKAPASVTVIDCEAIEIRGASNTQERLKTSSSPARWTVGSSSAWRPPAARPVF